MTADRFEQDQRLSSTFEKERRRLLAFIRRRIPDEIDAEDLLQDVFCELVEAYRLFGIAWVGIMGLVTVSLWNALMPAILGLPRISFWQALGLLLLSRILFGRFGGFWTRIRKSHFVRGWHDLTPEERQRFRQVMHPQRPQDLS